MPKKNTNVNQIGDAPLKEQSTPQKFIKNDRYFTITIYAFLLVLASAIVIKAIVNFAQTRAAIMGVLRAISPFLIALLIAYFLTPFVRAVSQLLRKIFKRMPIKLNMVLSLIIVYTLGLGLIIALLTYILPEVVVNIGELIGLIPKGYALLKDLLIDLQERFPNIDLSSFMNMLTSTQSDVMSELQNIAGEAVPALYTASVSIVTWFANFLIAIIVSIYMMYGKKHLLRSLKILLYAWVPTAYIPQTKKIVKDCNKIFSSFLISKMMDSVIIGILCAILMSILRLPYVFLISVFVGITNMIPYFGPFIGAVPGVIIILVVSPIKALVFLIMILCLQQFDGLYLGPKLMGDATALKPIWIIFAITIGGKFFGVLGMFLGVPFVAIAVYLANIYMTWRLSKKGLDIEQIH